MPEPHRPRQMTRRDFLKGAGVAALGLATGLGGCGGSVVLPPPLPPMPPRPVTERGVCYGPFRPGQDPDWGPYPTAAQIAEDMPTIAQETDLVRIYGSNDYLVPAITEGRKNGVWVAVGAWIYYDSAVNDEQLNALIRLANAHANVHSAVVGSEVLRRGDITKDELKAFIREVKSAVSCPVTTADIYSIWLANPDLAADIDDVMVHIYPFHDGVPIGSAADYLLQKYREVQAAIPGKRIVIGETGWPSNLGDIHAYKDSVLAVCDANEIPLYLFEMFDEPWKEKYEGEDGKHWGHYTATRARKYDEPIFG